MIVEKTFADQVKGITDFDAEATISLKSYKPNHLIYEANSKNTQAAVFSEIYYQNGWNAYLDNKLVPYFRANYAIRGLVVPAGKHSVEFKFEPKLYYTSKNISYAGSFILALFIIGGLFLGFKKKDN